MSGAYDLPEPGEIIRPAVSHNTAQLAWDGRWIGESLDGTVHVAATQAEAQRLAAQYNCDVLFAPPKPRASGGHHVRTGTGPLGEIAGERLDDIAHAGRFDEVQL